jgi:gliding motility-associated-like protein
MTRCVLFICLFFALPICLIAQPAANFTSNITTGCSPIVVLFTDQSTGSPTSWSWDLGNSTTSTLQNPSTTYITPGTYTVRLIATNAGGSDTEIKTGYITVYPSPIVNFKVDDSSLSCPPKTVQFTNLSVPGSAGTTSYLWDFGDGNTSTQINPSHTYNSSGNYAVSLIVTNSSGCTKSLTKPNYIQIIAKPVANFTGNNINSCAIPVTASFTNTSTNGSTYAWDFGDGGSSTATNPSHTYSTAGSYTVKLIVTNAAGCKDTMIKTGFVKAAALNAAFNISGAICVNKTVSFVNTTTPATATYEWSFGDGDTSSQANPTHTYITATSYTVRLIATDSGCKDTVYQTITANAKPSIAFSANTTAGCTAPLTVNFTNSTTNATSYVWLFGDGGTSTATNPSHTYLAAGNYTVQLVATTSAGCTDTLTKADYIKIQTPTATITVTAPSTCIPATIGFAANITSLLSVTNYNWNFGDGSSAVSCASCSTQSHTYTTSGNYTVTLTYVTGNCTLSTTTPIAVGSKPTASFSVSPTTICPGQSVTATNASTGATNYFWYVNGHTDTATNPSFTLTEPGTDTITLIAYNNGCPDTTKRTVVINLPRARFAVSYACSSRRTIVFTDQSQGASTYSWNFGDGNTSTTSGSVTHTYASYGIDTVTLTVYNTTTGCTHTYRRILNLSALTAQFTASDTTLCVGQVVSFTAGTHPNYSNYIWDYGNGIFSGQNAYIGANNSYSTPGYYTVKLFVADTAGCMDSMVKVNHIRVGGPTVAFSGTPLTGCNPLTVNFTDQSTTNAGFSITNRSWDFGDGGTSSTSGATTSHVYPVIGKYTVTLTVTDANSCSTTLAKIDYVNVVRPVAGFTVSDTNVCIGQQVSFTNTSTGSNLSYLWNFGDGGASTATNPTHGYSTTGNYNVKLVIYDPTGCNDSITKTALIHVTSLNVAFSMSDSLANCPPLVVNMTNNSVNAVSYNWNFSNGGQSTLTNPTASFTYPGIYTIKLVGTNAFGCKDSAAKSVTVKGPTGTFSYSPVNGCNPVTINFSATVNNTQKLTWDMNNGYTQLTTSTSFTYTYTQSGKFVPKLILSDSTCLVPLIGADTIKVDQINADFSFTPGTLCYAGTVQFFDTVLSSMTSVNSRSWNFGDNGTDTAHNPSHTYVSPGTYQVRLVIGNTQGCLDTIIKTVKVNQLPNVTASPNQSICQGQTNPVMLQASGAASYVWTPSTGLSCTTCANPNALPTSTTTYTVTGTDSNGCTDTGIVTITVNPKPVITVDSNKSVCLGQSVQLQAGGGATYVWTPTAGLSCATCANPVATPSTTTTYKVTGTNSFGCSDSATVTITVKPLPDIIAATTQSICIGATAQLQATGGTSYVWTPSTGLSCTTCANPTATPTATTTYTVTGTGSNGCTDTGVVTITVNPKPNVTAAPSQAICIGNAVQLLATGAASYVWTPSTGLSCTTCANPVASPTSTTTYTVTGTDANGCTDTGVVTITVNQKPNVSAGTNQTICPGGSATLQATGALTYVWTPSTGLSCTTCSNPVASPSTTTTYTVTGTDANGCTNTSTVTITVAPKPTISAGTNKTICTGSSVQLQATGGVSYVWSPGTGLSCTSCSNPIASPTVTVTYKVIGTGSNGCVDSAFVTVKVNALPTVSAGSNVSICTSNSTTLTASGASIYVWSPGTGLSCTVCPNPVASPSSTTTYTVTGTDTNGCVNTASVVVTVNPIPNIGASGPRRICNGEAASLLATGGTSYTWSPAGTLSCTACPNPMATPTMTTTYKVVGTLNGCSDSTQITITVLPKPLVSAGADGAVCIGNAVQLNASGATTYAWTPTTGLSCTSCNNPVANPSATTTYTVTGTDDSGCTNTDQVKVTIYPSPVVDAGPDQNICNGSTAQLQATGATNYVWTPAAFLSCITCSNPKANPQTQTTYKVVGTDVNGCSDSDEVVVSVIHRGPVNVNPGGSFCIGESLQLLASGGSDYLWMPSEGLSNDKIPNPIATPVVTTTYKVVIKQGDCFTDTAQVTITVHEKPYVELGKDITTVAGTEIILNPDGNKTYQYSWTPADMLNCSDCVSPVTVPKRKTSYRVEATNEWGCKASDDITIYTTCDVSKLFIANTFTPNGDGANDRFFPQGRGIMEIRRFSVYNRWGQILHDVENIPLNDPAYGWDGTYENEPMKPDVFVYVVYAVCESGEVKQIKGDISLIR